MEKGILTFRALVIGALAIFAGSWVLQRVELVYGGPGMAVGVLGPLPVFLLVGLVVVRRWVRLEKGELLAVYLIAAVGLPLASTGWVHYLLPGLVTGTYVFADETGRHYPFLMQIPSWMMPGGIGSEAAEGFFEGRVEGVPWRAWILPLACWSALLVGFAAALFGLAGLLRRRWIEEEHLRFPLTELPLELVEKGASFLKSRAMWAGFLVPALLYGVNGIHHYFLVPGEIPQHFDFGEVLLEEPWRAMAPYTSRFIFYFSPLLVGLVYLMSVEVAFSSWFFFLLTRLQLLIGEVIGRSDDHGTFIGLGGQWREWPNFFPHFQSQARGGLLCVALLSLWAARRSLREGLKDRGAVWPLAGGLALLVLWGWAAGLSPLFSLGYSLLALLTMVGMMRLRLDGGLPATGMYFLLANLFFFVLGTGPDAFAPGEYVAFAFLTLLSYAGVGGVMMVHFEGVKMAEVVKAGRKRLGWVLIAGLSLGLLAGYWSTLELIYQRGIFTLDQQGAARSMARIGRYFHYLYAEAGTRSGGTDWDRLGAMGFGFAVAGGLALMRLFFLRFPFHPLGFVYGTGLGTLLWGSALVGWAIKVLVVRYGGAASYRRLRPFFLGMIWGELALRLAWGSLALIGDPGGGYDWW